MVRRSHAFLAVLVALIWGVNFMFVEIGLGTFPPLLFVTLRFILAAFPAMLFVPRPKVRLRDLIAVGSFIGIGQFGLVFVAMNIGMPAGLSSLVLQSQALFTLAFCVVMLRERPQRYQLVGLLVATVGIVVVGAGRQLSTPLVPFLLVLAAGASWGAGNIATQIAQPDDGLRLVIWSSLVPPVPMLALSYTLEGPNAIANAFTSLGWTGLGSLLYVVVLSTLVGYGIWMSLLRRYPASMVAPFSLVVPVAGIAAAWLVLGENLTVTEAVGGAVVLAGLAVINRLHAWRPPRHRTITQPGGAAHSPAGLCVPGEVGDSGP